jgi:hypothetical protein
MTGPELRMMALELKHAVAAIERACLLAQGSELRPTWTACLKLRLDAAKGKANGSAAAPAMAEVVETGPDIARASATVLNDYYALKKRWNEQQRHG